ncbi:PREDICTED: tripartite motif-containing protein 7-like [Nanorana parkeri]|uniref:tripartite motif-containing protein 7-like n=1 Tax=Nanorana parkeri TaxID=125878 RepID=UPI0008549753|nr:PREDICTED: tripartite motif-containing protein 7-like [Nanorana parkeri]
MPVTLRCGHNFCQACIAHALETQEVSGVYSCPECREKLLGRPGLQVNSNLQNIVEKLYSKQPLMEEFTIHCTYCVDSPRAAVKTCLDCESSFCNDHLKVHGNSDGHKIINPTASLEDQKCSVHKAKLMFYCYEDAQCICIDCCLAKHMEHDVRPIDEASEAKKGKLRRLLNVLASKEEATDHKIWNFQENMRERQEKDIELAEKATALFRNIRRHLEVLEKKVLTEIFSGGDEFSQHVSGVIKSLALKKNELSKKMRHIEELCNMTNPITFLQDQKSDREEFCVPEEWDKSYLNGDSNRLLNTRNVDEGLISETIHSGLCDIVSDLSTKVSLHEASDILLDVNTAAANITVSQDMKTVTLSHTDQYYPESPERFEDGQILTCRNFSSGRHYWEVETSDLGDWMMGLAYASIDRHGEHSWLGENAKSWCLTRYQNRYSVIHNGQELPIPHQCLCKRFRIYLDYEAGRLSFYELGDPIRHLHTFAAIFTEPLHAAFGVLEDKDDCWVRITS